MRLAVGADLPAAFARRRDYLVLQQGKAELTDSKAVFDRLAGGAYALDLKAIWGEIQAALETSTEDALQEAAGR